MQPETFASRDRMRLGCDVRLVYGTRVDQVREILRELTRVLREHPKLWGGGDGTSVVLRELGVAALGIEVNAFFSTTDANEFAEIRQNVLLEFMHVVEAAGTQLALPAQRIELTGPETHSPAASDIQELNARDTSRQA
jgi:MscS family membrane protein